MRPAAHKTPTRFALSIVTLAAIPSLGGCIPVKGVAFRDSALPAIETGISTILDGVVSGVFAAIAVEPASQSSDNSGSSSDQR